MHQGLENIFLKLYATHRGVSSGFAVASKQPQIATRNIASHKNDHES